MPIPRKMRLFWPLLSGLLLADCATKELAQEHLVPWVPEPVIGDVVRLTLAYNQGGAMSFSVGPYSRVIFSVTAMLAVVVLLVMYRRTDSRATATLLALALVMGGALGNLLDRLRSGRGVVDFIDLGIGDVRFWTFNVADIGVSIGAILLAWQLSRTPNGVRAAPGPPSR